MDLDASRLRLKRNIEFGADSQNKASMPQIETLPISIIYEVANAEDAWMLNSTFPSVIRHFPGALEAIVVVRNAFARSVYQEVLRGFQGIAPFPLHVVDHQRIPSSLDVLNSSTRRDLMSMFVSSLSADEYCSGRFLMHLDIDSVLLNDVTYDSVFHFGAPVIPYKRSGFDGEG